MYFYAILIWNGKKIYKKLDFVKSTINIELQITLLPLFWILYYEDELCMWMSN